MDTLHLDGKLMGQTDFMNLFRFEMEYIMFIISIYIEFWFFLRECGSFKVLHVLQIELDGGSLFASTSLSFSLKANKTDFCSVTMD